MDKIINYFKNLTWEQVFHILTSWYGILFIACALCLLIFFISALCFNSRKSNKVMMAKNQTIVRLFSIHYKKGYVYAFNKFDLKVKRKESLEWFYETYSSKDRNKVEAWLQELQNEDHTVPHHLELQIKVKTFKQPVFSVISVSSINYNEGIIHLESRMFPNIKKLLAQGNNTKNNNNNNNKKKSKTIAHYKDLQEVVSMNINAQKNIFLIRLYSTNELDDLSRVSHLVITLIISRLLKFCSDMRFICLLNPNEILLVDFKTMTKNEAYALSHTLSNEISKVLFLSSIYEEYKYKIGIVQKKECSPLLAEEIKIAREMSICAQEEDNETNVAIYDESRNYKQNNQEAIINSIRNLMDRRSFTCSYTPILNTYDGSIFGYKCDLSGPNALLNSIEDMQDYAFRNNFLVELNRILYIETNQIFNFNAKSNRFVYTTMNLKLSQYLTYIDSFVHTNTPNNVKTIFIIEDEDINNDQKIGLKIIKELKNVGMCLGLKISSTKLELAPEIMKLFDFFLLYEDSFQEVYESQNQILYSDMISRLSTYSAQIISLNVSSWPLIDFSCKHDIKHISSPLFSTTVKQLPEINSKKLNKFNNICRHYERKK